MFKSKDFEESTALLAALALAKILVNRTRVKVVHGEEFVVPGTLGDALHLPEISHRLESRSAKSRGRGLDEFCELWDTLSRPTRSEVLDAIGWYEPNALDWEDKRSNFKPDISPD